MTKLATFGHSTLDEQQALSVLASAGIQVLVDVRSHPTSHWPQWERDALSDWIPAGGLDYTWLPELGGWDVQHADLAEPMARLGVDITPYLRGWFPKKAISRRLESSGGPSWTVGGFWDYQWFMTLPAFDAGVQRLLALTERLSIAIMCAELLPWACHRSMIADYLLHFYRVDALHLQPRPQAHSSWHSRIERYDKRAMAAMTRNAGGQEAML